MTRRHISLKDIATELNLSISTVSRALRDHPDISAEVKERVCQLAERWNYRPNPMAMGLLKSNTHIIGVIIPDLATHFYSSIVSGIDNVASRMGYYTIISSSYESFEKEKVCVENMINARVEGIIACISQETQTYDHFKLLADWNVPLVFFDRVCLETFFSSVVSNNQESSYFLTKHLISKGYKRIAYLGGPAHLNITRERKAGYEKALSDYNIREDATLMSYNILDYETGREATEQLLNLPEPPDAIIGMNDTLSYAAMSKIKEHGLRIPQDIALTGYTDEFHSQLVDPKLTAVSHPRLDMGERAAELLFEQLKGDTKVKQLVCDCNLLIQEST